MTAGKRGGLRMYLNSPAENIPSNKAAAISLDDALAEMGVLPSYKEYQGGFIGFVNDKGESIQFIRFDENSWFVDAPFVKMGDYAFSRQIEIPYSTARRIVESFYRGEDLRKYFIMPQPMPKLLFRPPFFRLMVTAFTGLMIFIAISLLVVFSGFW